MNLVQIHSSSIHREEEKFHISLSQIPESDMLFTLAYTWIYIQNTKRGITCL